MPVSEKNKVVDQFIIDNHAKMSNKDLAKACDTTYGNITFRKSQLKKKGLLVGLDAIDTAYKQASKKVTKDDVKSFIFKWYTKKSRETMAKSLNVSNSIISANFATLKRQGLVFGDLIKDAPSKSTGNSYSNADGENKEKARYKMVNVIDRSKVEGLVLTLPHIACKIEKQILNWRPNMKFIGCEIDKPTFNAMKKTIKNDALPIEPYFGKIADKIYGVEAETYAHMILDYCGSVVTFDKELRYAIQNNLVKVGGTISVTFNKRGHHDPTNIIKKLATIKSNVEDTRGEMERGVIAYFHKLIGFNYEITEVFNYQDKGKSPMMMVQIKRVI